MRFTRGLEKLFILAIVFPLGYLGYNGYQSYLFDKSPLAESVQKRIQQRSAQVLERIAHKYNIRPKIPLIVSDEFNSRLYGLTGYKAGEIHIYLNKKRFKESEDYMIEEVIPHEYAHAMIFLLGEKTPRDGHSQRWREVCLELGGRGCERYVDNEEIIRQKMGLK